MRLIPVYSWTKKVDQVGKTTTQLSRITPEAQGWFKKLCVVFPTWSTFFVQEYTGINLIEIYLCF